METLTGGTPMPLSYVQRQRQGQAVPGREGQDMRATRVRTATPEYTGRRAGAAHVRPTGGKVSDDFGRAAETPGTEPTTTRSERQRIQRRNRAIFKRGR